MSLLQLQIVVGCTMVGFGLRPNLSGVLIGAGVGMLIAGTSGFLRGNG